MTDVKTATGTNFYFGVSQCKTNVFCWSSPPGKKSSLLHQHIQGGKLQHCFMLKDFIKFILSFKWNRSSCTKFYLSIKISVSTFFVKYCNESLSLDVNCYFMNLCA